MAKVRKTVTVEVTFNKAELLEALRYTNTIDGYDDDMKETSATERRVQVPAAAYTAMTLAALTGKVMTNKPLPARERKALEKQNNPRWHEYNGRKKRAEIDAKAKRRAATKKARKQSKAQRRGRRA